MIRIEFFEDRKEVSSFCRERHSLIFNNVRPDGFIATNIPKTQKDVFVLFHELGHAADKKLVDCPFDTIQTWANELRAWAYAAIMLCPCQRQALYEFAIECLHTYAKDIPEVYGILDLEIANQLYQTEQLLKKEYENEENKQNSNNMDSCK